MIKFFFLRRITRLTREARAATAIEFALVAPPLIILFLLFIMLGLVIWNWNAMQEAAFEAARCIAISSPDCASTGIVPYTVGEAHQRGAYAIVNSDVTVYSNPANISKSTCGGGVGTDGFTIIYIQHTYSVLSYHLPLTATACFPNN